MPRSSKHDQKPSDVVHLTPKQRIREWALAVFGNDELAECYLQRRNPIFGGKAPVELARTHAGADLVIEELTEATYGVPIIRKTKGGRAARPPAWAYYHSQQATNESER